MAWKLADIKAAFDRGAAHGHSHMLVAYDDFDREEYPIYVPKGEDPQAHRPDNGDRVLECYSYALPWAQQAAEPRANHWDIIAAEGGKPIEPLS
jgi:hypothetical protein